VSTLATHGLERRRRRGLAAAVLDGPGYEGMIKELRAADRVHLS
jgi:hypothetical protein